MADKIHCAVPNASLRKRRPRNADNIHCALPNAFSRKRRPGNADNINCTLSTAFLRKTRNRNADNIHVRNDANNTVTQLDHRRTSNAIKFLDMRSFRNKERKARRRRENDRGIEDNWSHNQRQYTTYITSISSCRQVP